jgi:hypothetical protein
MAASDVTYGVAADRDGNGYWAQMAIDTVGVGDGKYGTAKESAVKSGTSRGRAWRWLRGLSWRVPNKKTSGSVRTGKTIGAKRCPQILLTNRFLWRPAISLGAGAAHQRGPFSVARAVSLQEGLDGLLVVDNSERARPVGAPEAAVETPGVAGAASPD